MMPKNFSYFGRLTTAIMYEQSATKFIMFITDYF